MLDQDEKRYNLIAPDELEMFKIRNMFLFRHRSNRQSPVGRFDWSFGQRDLACRSTDIRHGP